MYSGLSVFSFFVCVPGLPAFSASSLVVMSSSGSLSVFPMFFFCRDCFSCSSPVLRSGASSSLSKIWSPFVVFRYFIRDSVPALKFSWSYLSRSSFSFLLFFRAVERDSALSLCKICCTVSSLSCLRFCFLYCCFSSFSCSFRSCSLFMFISFVSGTCFFPACPSLCNLTTFRPRSWRPEFPLSME